MILLLGVVTFPTALVRTESPAGGSSEPPLIVTSDITLDPGKLYGAIVIKSSGVVIDGRGALLRGSAAAAPKDFKGVAITSDGVSRVTLKNLKARGWETGLRVRNAEDWTIENCDFSDNYHDPEFGWGENGRRGGIVLEKVRRSKLIGNRAHRIWDACALIDSDENIIERNDFSEASNTCLKLWTSCRNTVKGNVLAKGIRISPGEVHAHDSSSVLIESGSNDNRFLNNDCTGGGDGIFIRVLNGWCSTGNYFENNDVSKANNNGFECWAPNNTFVRNKANDCSYGFWLGGSDKTRLIGNEASNNGLTAGMHNSPHLPDSGHAGIVFMFGPSSHTLARDNVCRGNNGAGIATRGRSCGESRQMARVPLGAGAKCARGQSVGNLRQERGLGGRLGERVSRQYAEGYSSRRRHHALGRTGETDRAQRSSSLSQDFGAEHDSLGIIRDMGRLGFG